MHGSAAPYDFIGWLRWQYRKRRRAIGKGKLSSTMTDFEIRERNLEKGGHYTFRRRMDEYRQQLERIK